MQIRKPLIIHFLLILLGFSITIFSIFFLYNKLDNTHKNNTKEFKTHIDFYENFSNLKLKIVDYKIVGDVIFKENYDASYLINIKKHFKNSIVLIDEHILNFNDNSLIPLKMELTKNIKYIEHIIEQGDKEINPIFIQEFKKSTANFFYNFSLKQEEHYKNIHFFHENIQVKLQDSLKIFQLIFSIIFILFIVSLINIYKRKTIEEKLFLKYRTYQTLFHKSPNGILLLNQQGNILKINSKLCNLLNINKRAVQSKSYSTVFEDESIQKLIDNQYTEAEIGHLEIFKKGLLKNKDNEKIRVEYSVQVCDDGDQVFYFLVFKNMEELFELTDENSKLKSLANRDPLTNIFNRRYLEEQSNLILNDKHYSDPVSFIYFDIDFFKKINDNYGHDVGDFILKSFVEVISKEIRNEDIFGRVGGEEFLLIIKKLNYHQIKNITERLKDKVEERKFNFNEQKISITVSIGVCYLNDSKSISFEDCLKKADKALYTAKNKGRNNVQFVNYEEISID